MVNVFYMGYGALFWLSVYILALLVIFRTWEIYNVREEDEEGKFGFSKIVILTSISSAQSVTIVSSFYSVNTEQLLSFAYMLIPFLMISIGILVREKALKKSINLDQIKDLSLFRVKPLEGIRLVKYLTLLWFFNALAITHTLFILLFALSQVLTNKV